MRARLIGWLPLGSTAVAAAAGLAAVANALDWSALRFYAVGMGVAVLYVAFVAFPILLYQQARPRRNMRLSDVVEVAVTSGSFSVVLLDAVYSANESVVDKEFHNHGGVSIAPRAEPVIH